MDNNVAPDKSGNKLIIICSILCLVIFIGDTLIPLGVAGGVPYIIAVIISFWDHRKKLPVYMAITGSILTIIGYYSSPAGDELWKVVANRSIALFAIWVVAILGIQRRRLYDEKEKELQGIITLSGFLPICSSCKKIRDDKGQWNQIESYITDRSEVQFSHSICPDCAKRIYKDLNIYDDSKST